MPGPFGELLVTGLQVALGPTLPNSLDELVRWAEQVLGWAIARAAVRRAIGGPGAELNPAWRRALRAQLSALNED